MIRVVHSNRIEALVDALAETLPAAGDAVALFDGPWLVVPSRPLTLWVNLELARRRGVAGQIDTMTFDGMFARLTSESLPDVVLIERGHIVGELLALMGSDAFMTAAALAPLASYLRAAGDDGAAIDRRRVDLALALGRLFDDWTMSRPEVLKTWRASGSEGGGDAAPLERAERALFTALFGADGRFARRGASEGRRYLTRDAFLGASLDAGWRPPTAVHVFAPADVSAGVQLTLARLGQRTDVRVYAVNPCREFWEDLETGRGPSAPQVAGLTTAAAPARTKGRGRQAAPNPRQLDLLAPAAAPVAPTTTVTVTAATTGHENPWLAAWGRAGRELVARLNALTEQNFEFRAVDPDAPDAPHPGSILGHVQRDILERRPRREGERDGGLSLDADGSITLLGAPNPRREIESVAAEIWRLIRADEAEMRAATDAGRDHRPLRFSDIAVLVAGPAEPHLSLCPEVFHEAGELPHAIVDRGFGARSGLPDAVLALVALPLGALTRREVLDVVTHVNIRARFPDADPRIWLKLCEALTIAHGADREAHAGTYIDRDAFNWDQGCRRLVLGRFARGPRSGVEEPVVLAPDSDGYGPAEVGPELRDDADALATLIRSLLADVRFARGARLTVPEWMRFVRALMAAYVVPVSPDDESARLAVFAALDQLGAQAAPVTTVPLAVAVELLRASLADLRGARGQMLGAGVVVGSLGTLRALPFRVVFVVGLEPQRFPSGRGPAPLDVLAGGGGDESPRDADRYLFLEATLATRDRLVLSHVDRDQVTGETREPSSVILDLMDELRRGYVEDASALARRVPLHRDEDDGVRNAFPMAAAEDRARQVGDAIRRLPGAGPWAVGDPRAMVKGLGAPARHALAPLLALMAAPARVEADGAPAAARAGRRQRTIVTLTDLRRFLECPLQGSARVFLGLRDLPDDTDARETTDEPFDLPRMFERGLLSDVVAASWTAARPPDAATLAARYQEATARYRAAHRLPTALFRANVHRRHLFWLRQWVNGLGALTPPLEGPIRRLCFGRPEPFAPPAEHREPISLTVELPGRGRVDLELHGTTEPLVRVEGADTQASLVLATSTNDENNGRDSLRAFIDAMAIAVSGAATATEAALAVVCRPGDPDDDEPATPYRLPFGRIDPAGARAYLTALATALLGRMHDYLFPCDAVFRAADRDMSLVDGVEQTRADVHYRRYSASNYGPVPHPFDYPAPTEAEAQRYGEERFGPLLAARKAAKEARAQARAEAKANKPAKTEAGGKGRGRRA